MILMLAPGSAPGLTFNSTPSGSVYVSNNYGLIFISNNSVLDQDYLITQNCSTLEPYGEWGSKGFALLTDLYAADIGNQLQQYTLAAVFDDVEANIGFWAKTGTGFGIGNWTRLSTITLEALYALVLSNSTDIATETSRAENAEYNLGLQISALAAYGHYITGGPVEAATVATLPANTYANGSSGVGATLTGNANAALSAQDGVTLTVNQRLLVRMEASGLKNGIYALTQVGDGSHPYILTRVTDADTAAELASALVAVKGGSTQGGTIWLLPLGTTAITVGTTALTFTKLMTVGTWNVIIPEMYGAVGNGSTDDVTSMQAMWNALPSSGGVVVQTPGKNYAQSAACTVNGKSFVAFAYGSTNSLLDGASSYTILAVNRTASAAAMIDYFEWHGGIADGNGYNQSWPGSLWPGSDNMLHNTYGNTGLIGVWWCKRGKFVGTKPTRCVSEGLCLAGVQWGKFDSPDGYNAVPLTFGTNGFQGTMFKGHYEVTVPDSVIIWDHPTGDSGSIFVHAQSGVDFCPGSTAIIIAPACSGMVQDALHIEHAANVFIMYPVLKASDQSIFVGQIQIGSLTEVFHVTGGRIDGNIWATESGGHLISGTVDGTVVNDLGPPASAGWAIDIGAHGRVFGVTVTSVSRGGINSGVVGPGTTLLSWAPGTSMIQSAYSVDGVIGTGGGATGAGKNNGINNFQGGNILNTTITDVVTAVQTTAGVTKINNLTTARTGQCAIQCDTSTSKVKIRGSSFSDFGIDTGSAAYRRAAVGGSAVGAVGALIDIRDTTIERTGSVADANNIALYRVDTANKTIYLDNEELGLAEPCRIMVGANTGTKIIRDLVPTGQAFAVDIFTPASTPTDFTATVSGRATILRMKVYTKTAFAASGAVQIQIGSSVGASDYVVATSIKALGVYDLVFVNTSAASLLRAEPGSPNLFIRLTQGGTPSATGEAYLVIEYAHDILV